jgi:hypothetical protein
VSTGRTGRTGRTALPHTAFSAHCRLQSPPTAAAYHPRDHSVHCAPAPAKIQSRTRPRSEQALTGGLEERQLGRLLHRNRRRLGLQGQRRGGTTSAEPHSGVGGRPGRGTAPVMQQAPGTSPPPQSAARKTPPASARPGRAALAAAAQRLAPAGRRLCGGRGLDAAPG